MKTAGTCRIVKCTKNHYYWLNYPLQCNAMVIKGRLAHRMQWHK